MAIIAGQRALRKSLAADVIREWAPIAKEPPRRVADFRTARSAGTILTM